MPARLPITLILVALVALATPGVADTKITTKVSDSGQQATTKTVWFGGDRVREDGDARAVIVDLAARRLLLVDHRAKTYNDLELPLDITAMLPEVAREAYTEMLERMSMEVDVRPTELSAQVAGFDATRTDVTLSNEHVTIDMEVWTSADVDVPLEQYRALMIELAALQPAAGKWMERILEIPGYPVRIVNRAAFGGQSMEHIEELVSVEQLDPPEGLYAAPAGYKAVAFDPMAGMTAGR